ncbi:MAG: glutamate-5-semialdehyde dehydrogenase [Ruminococcaceae bacterium]|nr:glutamate-5-semialdehyde dehydrogenase [Oscillospiraceae bacterium]
MDFQAIGAAARSAAAYLAAAGQTEKNRALAAISAALRASTARILAANAADIAAAEENGIKPVMVDRLRLTEARIAAIADGVDEVIALNDPTGEVLSMTTRPNGLVVGKKRVPLGVVGIIFESRPNVTVDAAVLCLKSGNACILRGGREALKSNLELTAIMREALISVGMPADCVNLLNDTTREGANAMMRGRGVLDVLIPRGGAGLIKAVVENSSVPVIETGTGNCHVYLEASADPEMAVSIVYNAKTSRPSVCNAAESLLVDEAAAEALLPKVAEKLAEKNVALCGCEKTRAILGDSVREATEEDYATEFLDYAMSVKVVSGIDEAIAHINRFSTHHSEAIVTKDYAAAQRFLNEIDSAAVYVNASTRFTDGNEFGEGAEIGISTQKLHARGPMGLAALTSVKYIVYGSGQIR